MALRSLPTTSPANAYSGARTTEGENPAKRFATCPHTQQPSPRGGFLRGGSGRWCAEAEMLTHRVDLDRVHPQPG
jgi:hypothetical protein